MRNKYRLDLWEINLKSCIQQEIKLSKFNVFKRQHSWKWANYMNRQLTQKKPKMVNGLAKMLKLYISREHPVKAQWDNISHPSGWQTVKWSSTGLTRYVFKRTVLLRRISWREEPGGLPSMGSQRIGYEWANNTHTHTHTATVVWIFTTALENCLSTCKIFQDVYSYNSAIPLLQICAVKQQKSKWGPETSGLSSRYFQRIYKVKSIFIIILRQYLPFSF